MIETARLDLNAAAVLLQQLPRSLANSIHSHDAASLPFAPSADPTDGQGCEGHSVIESLSAPA